MIEWIKLEDRKPEYGAPVLIVDSCGEASAATLYKSRYGSKEYWMPLNISGHEMYWDLSEYHITHWAYFPDTPYGKAK
jgi:hypothetical protein